MRIFYVILITALVFSGCSKRPEKDTSGMAGGGKQGELPVLEQNYAFQKYTPKWAQNKEPFYFKESEDPVKQPPSKQKIDM